jgi:hypothetical protein
MLREIGGLVGDLDLSAPPEVLLLDDKWVEVTQRAARVLEMVRTDLAE